MPKSKQPAQPKRKPLGGIIHRCTKFLKRLGSWLSSAWKGPRDPVLHSLLLVKRYGNSGLVSDQQWHQLSNQARSLAQRGDQQSALTMLHCLLLLKPDSATVQAQVEQLTARQHKLSLNSKGISGTTRAYRKQQLNFYIQQRAVEVLEAAAEA